ncbi:MAG: CapA family protein [Firmicutes bacterium]|nr:CapA family protein [Bacillota bacterium]
MKINRVGIWFAICILIMIFSNSACFAADGKSEITITFVGDVQPHVLERASKKQMDYIRRQFADSEFVFCNLETPLTNHSQLTSGKSRDLIKSGKDYAFKANPSSVKTLNEAGFSVVCLANNHMMDYTDVGLTDTIRALNRAGICYCGAGENKDRAEAPVILESKKSGIKVAFISYSEIAPLMSDATSKTPGIAYINYPPGPGDISKIEKSIKTAKAKGADIVIVTLHWGKEKSSRFESYQKDFAKKLFEAGADCVIGHHPHVLRNVEKTGGKTIAYSLGNFVFDSADRKTMALTVTFSRNGSSGWLQSIKTKPMYIENGIPVKL